MLDKIDRNLDFSVTQLRAFATVAETLSYVDSAKILGYTEPAIHHQVKRLEGLLGCRLFVRDGRGLNITEHGERVLPRCLSILRDVDSLIDLAYARRELDSLAIAAGPVTAAYMLPSILADYDSEGDRTELRVFADQNEMLSRIRDGEVDIGIAHGLDRRANLSEFSLQPWKNVQYCLFGAPGTRIEQPEVPPIYATNMTAPCSILLDQLGGIGYSTPRIEFLHSADAVKNMCIAGLGIGFLRSDCVTFELHAGLIDEVDLVDTPINSRVWIVQLRDRPLSDTAVRFTEYLLSRPD